MSIVKSSLKIALVTMLILTIGILTACNSKTIPPEQLLKEVDQILNGNEDKPLPYQALGVIDIPNITKAAVIDEVDSRTQKMGVGHFKESALWDGNICMFGSRTSFFRDLNRINIDEKITYRTKFGTRVYTVTVKRFIDKDDLSVLENSPKNMITLITDIEGKEDQRYCIQGVESVEGAK